MRGPPSMRKSARSFRASYTFTKSAPYRDHWVQNQTSRRSIGARLCIRKQQSGANHSAEPTLIHVNAALYIADDFLPDKIVFPFVQPCALGVCLEHEDFIMPTHRPPVPPANRSKNVYGSDSGKEVSNDKLVKHEHHANAAEKGETANIKQNTTNKGFFRGRRFS